MTNKSTKSALLTSSISLLLCFAMLLGTTFAWFTDNVSSTNNIITAGNLDVEIYYQNDETDDWVMVDKNTNVFKEATLWEPGHTEVVKLKVVNEGTLALKYQLGVNIASEIGSINVAGEPFKLSDYIKYAVVEGAQTYSDSASAAAAVDANANKLNVAYDSGEITLESKAEKIVTMVVYMPTTVGNEANYGKGQVIPTIKLGINLVATQLEAEKDSFGADYDKDATLDFYPVSTADELKKALEDKQENIVLTRSIVVTEGYNVNYNATINGNGSKISRASGAALMTTSEEEPVVYTGVIFTVEAGATLTLENAIVDGGAIWTGEVNKTLQRGTVNTGITATGALVTTEANAKIILNKGAVLQNNDGANAVNLGTRVGAELIINGGEIINNHAAAGAIWGGGEIILNSGKISNNHGQLGGAIRAVTNIGTLLTMNGGEMNHNLSDAVGGAIWAGTSKSNNVYVLNGGEMAYNYSPSTGGAIYAGYYETVKIGGTFKMHDNDCAENIGSAIRFHDHASLIMTGGEVYNHDDNALFLNNNSASITGGMIEGNFGYSGGLGLTIGKADIDGVITYGLSTNHNTAYLAAEFNEFEFKVNESANFSQFNFKPADGYVYTEGDEAKLICKNAGYETYWDAATSTFRLRAK